jgi:hypothetical protein
MDHFFQIRVKMRKIGRHFPALQIKLYYFFVDCKRRK